jgi:hypothetical protein
MDSAARQKLDPAQRLRMLEDAEEIRWMKAYYVFAPDAIWGGAPDGAPPIQGREAIFQRLRLSTWTFAMHYYVNPVITLDGDSAHARWMLWEPCTAVDTNTAMWMSAVSEDDYVRTPEGWRLRNYVVHYKFLTPFDRPWTHRG